MSDAPERLSYAPATSRLPLCPDWRLWVLAGVIALIDAAWFIAPRFTINWRSFLASTAIITICLAWYCAGYFIRLRDGPRRFAIGVVFALFTGKCTAIFSQLIMTLPFPMADSVLAEWDRALGFDWIGYLSLVVARPWLSYFLLCIYNAFLPASFLAIFILPALGRLDRFFEYLAISFVAGVIAIVVGAAFPTIGAPLHHQAQALMEAFPPHTGAHWVRRLAELRSDQPIDLGKIGGLVSFPSYHVALSMIIAWCFRGFRLLFPFFALFALATAASAPIIGGHYFVDLIGGAALVCIIIIAGKIWRTFASAAIPALRAAEAPKPVPVRTPPE